MFSQWIPLLFGLITVCLSVGLVTECARLSATTNRLMHCSRTEDSWIKNESKWRNKWARVGYSAPKIAAVQELADTTGVPMPHALCDAAELSTDEQKEVVGVLRDVNEKLLQEQCSEITTARSLAAILVIWCTAMIVWSYFDRKRLAQTSSTTATLVPVKQEQPVNIELPEKVLQKLSQDFQSARDGMVRSINMSYGALHSTFVKSPVGIMVLNDDFSIDFVNQSLVSLIGTSTTDLMGANVDRVVIAPDIFDQTNSFASSDVLKDIEAKLVVSSGDTVPVELSITTFGPVDRRRYVVNVVDISRRSQLLRLRKETLLEVGHDLRAPLTSLKLFLTMISDGLYGELPPPVLAALGRVLPELDRLSRLTMNMLSSEEIDEGVIKLSMTRTRMDDVVVSAVASMTGAATHKRQQILTTTSGNQECEIDREKVTQALVNVLSNAIKYSPNNSTIEIRSNLQEGTIIVDIQDQGPGIAPAQAERIFDKFERDNRSEPGTGIGLWVTKKIMELHNGSICILPQEPNSKGTVFRLVFPAGQPSPPDGIQ